MNPRIEMNSERAEVYTDYNRDFVSGVKNLGGRWDAAKKCWTISEAAIEPARKLMRECYGIDDQAPAETVRVRLTVSEELGEYGAPVIVYGHVLARAYGRDSGARPGDGVIYREGRPKSGGSSKNWLSIVPADSVIELEAVDRELIGVDPLPSGVTAEVMDDAPAIDRGALEAEKARLLARLAEIEKLLAA